jgi:perosamine synthetase
MQPLLELAQRYELVMIEDAAEALGARYRGVPVGRLGGDVTCFSFNGNKLITTGGGGMLVTNNAKLAERARHLTTQAKQDPLEYIHDEMGFNYRLTNLQAALGCSQMEVLGQFIEKKRAIAARYDAAFAELSGVTPMRHAEWAFSTCWLYTVRIDAERFGLGSRELLKSLAKAQIQTRPLWQPMHRSPSFSHLQKVHCPVADRLCRDALSLPCSVGLTEAEQDHVIDTMASLARSRTAA